jgi:hypothetical protein
MPTTINLRIALWALLAPSVHVVTDVLDADISLAGGEMQARRSAGLSAGEEHAERPGAIAEPTIRPLQCSCSERSGRHRRRDAPTHQALYHSDVSELRLKPGQDELQLPLTWTTAKA